VWALGASLFHLVTGHPPFTGHTPFEIVAHVIADPVPDPRVHRPDLPPALAELILSAMAKAPAQRLASCTALITALDSFATGQPAPGPAPAFTSSAAVAPTMHSIVPR
jgi:serine/threonine-protein kinase